MRIVILDEPTFIEMVEKALRERYNGALPEKIDCITSTDDGWQIDFTEAPVAKTAA